MTEEFARRTTFMKNYLSKYNLGTSINLETVAKKVDGLKIRLIIKNPQFHFNYYETWLGENNQLMSW